MRLAFLYPALPTCLVVSVQKSDFHLINVFCVVIVVKKRKLLCLTQVVFFYFVLHSNKLPLVFTTEAYAARLCSHTFSVGLILEPQEGWIVTS